MLSVVRGPVREDLLRDETLADLFREAKHSFSQKTALRFQERECSYDELDRWSDAVALELVRQGVRRGDAVGLWWPRGLELHAAVLGIAKSGAAYVPMDADMPLERVRVVMKEVGAKACFCPEKQANFPCAILSIPEAPKNISEKIESLPEGPRPDDRAYVLFTSGSTGLPKGVPISHRQICHLIRAEETILKVNADDRVYQGFSVSFDMWCEETWISYHAGATIVVADSLTAKAVDELSDFLNREKITVLHAVPSLLGVMENAVPSLRLINAGGEALSPAVARRWAKPWRILLNSYGPTETTVTATMNFVDPNEPISIGNPLPNYSLAVVDESLQPMRLGTEGELVIAGPGLSEGYLNRKKITAEKFPEKPAGLSDFSGMRVYRTGDAALMSEDGKLFFRGRLDDQVKIRGYRVELGEIENRLKEAPGILESAVALFEDERGEKFLVGYVVSSENGSFDESKVKAALAKTLPSYMVPTFIQKLSALPRLTSGKVNRKALPKPDQPRHSSEHKKPEQNATPAEKMTFILRNMFSSQDADLEKDFFDDLGGHSLLAATLVSRLRKEADLPKASLRDLYLHRPLREAFAVWEKSRGEAETAKRAFSPTPWWRHLACGAAQTVALPFIYGLFAAQILLPYLGYYYVQDKTGSYITAILAALLTFCILPPVFTGWTIGLKWLVIGKMKAGDYPLWGSYYFRWWLVKTLQRLMPVHFITGTPLYPVYLKLLGARIAPDAQLSPIQIGAEDLVTIETDASLGSGTNLNNAFVEDGLLKLRAVHFGPHSYLGSGVVIAGDTRIEAWGELRDLSYLPKGGVIGEREVWIGSPARKEFVKEKSSLTEPLAVSRRKRFRYQALFTFFLLIFPFMILLPLLPSIIILNILDNASGDYDFTYLLITPGLALIYICVFAAFAVSLTRLLLRGIKPGVFPLYSFRYVRKWFADQIMSLSLMVLHPIYATLYVGTLFRALGAKVGKNAEISTANNVTHPLLSVGDGAFVADAVNLGELEVRGQRMILDTTSVGNNSFLGNSALLPQGTHLPENMLVGVLSTPPSPAALAGENAKDWFGSPAIALPRREKSRSFNESLTIRPTRLRRTARGLVELARILIPQTAVFCFSILFIAYTHDLLTENAWWQILLLFPFYYLGFVGVPAFLVALVFKWIFAGRYRGEQMPMWTWKVWRSEAATAIYEAISVPFLLDYCRGTPWLPVLVRLLGARIGKRVWLNTTDLTEFDMVEIGDEAALGEDSGPQTHLFEDRVMKVGPIRIGARTTVGAHSVILYDTEIGENVLVEPLSLVMKGERLAPGTRWSGSPIRPVA